MDERKGEKKKRKEKKISYCDISPSSMSLSIHHFVHNNIQITLFIILIICYV